MRDLTYVPEDVIVTYTKTDKIKSKSNDGQYVAYEVEKQEKPLVRCKDCKHQEHCHETVAHTRLHDGFKEHWSEPIEWCSMGERKGGEDE